MSPPAGSRFRPCRDHTPGSKCHPDLFAGGLLLLQTPFALQYLLAKVAALRAGPAISLTVLRRPIDKSPARSTDPRGTDSGKLLDGQPS
ncbi:unnamed protein product [Nezara viridula]|uniref:Uncharacterized protein n=1 Tax=Nezara viridula TaxID=85310 RepID=A0A9P0MPJ4_NEZVI|nr:unnamed protein product [Nezara viridula]